MFDLINNMEKILEESLNYQQNCGFTICKEIPDLVVHKMCKKIKKLQEMQILGTDKKSIAEYVDIAVRSYDIVNDANRDIIIEAVTDFATSPSQELSDFNITDPDHREQLKSYAVDIMKRNPDCDVHRALACAMKDCDPSECDVDDDYFSHVEQHFNEEDIEEVMNRARNQEDY